VNPVTLAFVLGLLVAVWWLVRIRQKAAKEDARSKHRAPSANTQFHAVSIKITGPGCNAAREMSGRRFLANAAPKLPLPGCDILECKCRFIHHKDRRAGKERRSPFKPGGIGGGTGAYDSEQRGGEDRRRDEEY
jgi:hypothetical protein